MAEETNVVHILVGTYELMVLMDLSAQINNRAWTPIEFRRYHAEDKEDRRMFKSILKTFDLYLPLEEEIDLVKDWVFFYEQTAGCVGTLKKLLHKALSAKLQDKNAEIPFREYIKNNALYSKQCLENLREAKEGEKRFDDMKCQLDQLKHELGFKTNTQDQDMLEIKVPEKKGRRDVGKRNPVRDPVGKTYTQDGQNFSNQ